MTDLHAPLGRDRPRQKAKDRASRAPRGSRFGLVAASLLVALMVAGNIAVIAATDRAPQTALVTLPGPTAASAPDTQTVTGAVAMQQTGQTGNTDVQIVYGDGQGNDGTPELPLPTFDDDGASVSPGGPKIITVRDPAAANVGQPRRIAHLPEDAALEDTDFGPLPVRTDTGRRPMDIYARPWAGDQGKRIAIVIGGLGLSQTGSHRAIESLPPEITLAFAPTGNSLGRWMREARKKGHELLVQVPMEPFGYPEVNPGPRTLRLASSAETNLENLHWALGRLTNYTGVMNYMGARFAGSETAMAPVLGDLSYRGLLFFNDGTAGGAELASAAARKGVPYLQADIVIDASRSRDDIEKRLKALEELATARGYAAGSGSALELTVSTVADWANDAKKRGFQIVGVAALANRRQ
ncbi:divergent polysaccharide deacetylase family protein [Oceaniradius stylonematis]|uniref:Divergent polysaccharide deacetylase family protein n=1 Tax=Oceaniradius stylonematis TaxID=2184161 RepID=A0A3A8AI80_9HYPH|nr:divergent polysaccharide deacetylase family protein [Oceaniradius stylonematis]RKF07390.1 divergent polysaccharide deacetylase family protein [Oceaniradius stylonematis]